MRAGLLQHWQQRACTQGRGHQMTHPDRARAEHEGSAGSRAWGEQGALTRVGHVAVVLVVVLELEHETSVAEVGVVERERKVKRTRVRRAMQAAWPTRLAGRVRDGRGQRAGRHGCCAAAGPAARRLCAPSVPGLALHHCRDTFTHSRRDTAWCRRNLASARAGRRAHSAERRARLATTRPSGAR